MESQLKEMLRRDKVKLWLPPYANEDFDALEIPDELIVKYSCEKGWPLESVRDYLVKLQSSAITRMVANKKFNETGVATVFVSCVKPDTTNIDANNSQKVEISLTDNGKNLRESVGQKFNLPLDHFKLIAAGRVIEDFAYLQEQGVAHLSEMLCVTLSADEIDHQKQLIWQMSVDQTKHAVSKLANQVQIADQSGKTLELPEEEKIALSTGMALHEKGKKELKAKQVGLALLCFLEADKEFSRCRGSILQAVDNYAILCLDIVWCYLQLQSVNSLPDAENRLKEAENGFRRSYGKNFERLAVIKKGVEHEKVLIIRLQLLQGILAYYNKNYKKAFHLLTEAEAGIRQLDVDGEKLVQIIQMGYTDSEARLGLRAANGNLEGAIQRIIEDREEAENRRQEENKKYKDRKSQSKLGKTKNGNWVDVQKYRDLISMGYIENVAADALKESNNDMNGALEYLYSMQSNGVIVSKLLENSNPSGDSNAAATSTFQENSAMQQLADMGFVSDQMMDIVNRNRGDVSGAVTEFLQMADTLLQQNSNMSHNDREQLQNLASNAVNEALKSVNIEADTSEEQAAWATLEEDVPEDLNAHLNITLEEEEQFLIMYKNLILPHVE